MYITTADVTNIKAGTSLTLTSKNSVKFMKNANKNIKLMSQRL